MGLSGRLEAEGAGKTIRRPGRRAKRPRPGQAKEPMGKGPEERGEQGL
jgi:hypothetical protein